MGNIIEKPSAAEIERCLKIWDESPEYEKYRHQEKSVVMLFREQYPKNTILEEVLIKACVLNDFYGTLIRNVYSVALNIVKQNIDESLANADVGIVDKIARVTINGKEIRFYSFATKYCSQHRPDVFPIYDSFVDKVLVHFRNEDKFYEFKNEKLRCYETFNNVILEFRKFYKLEQFSLKQLDQYLWTIGKENFSTPKKDADLKTIKQ